MTISALRALGDKTITIDKRLRFSTTFMFNTTLDTMMMLFALGGYDCTDLFRGSNAVIIRNFHLQMFLYVWFVIPYGWNTIRPYPLLSYCCKVQLRPRLVCANVQAGQRLNCLYAGDYFTHCVLTGSMRRITYSYCTVAPLMIHLRTLLVCLTYVAELVHAMNWYYFLSGSKYGLSGCSYMFCARHRQTHLWKPYSWGSVEQPRSWLGSQYAQTKLGICCWHLIMYISYIISFLSMACKLCQTTATHVKHLSMCVVKLHFTQCRVELNVVTCCGDIFSYAPSMNTDISDGLYCDVPNIFAVQEAAGTQNEHKGPVVGCEDKQPTKGLSCLGLRDYFIIRLPKFSEERPLLSTLTMIMAEVVAKLTSGNMADSSDPDETLQPVVARWGVYCMSIIHSTVIYVDAFCMIIIYSFFNE